MANSESGLEARPMDEVKRELIERARENRNPFLYTIFDEVAPVIEKLRSVERDPWAQAFGALLRRTRSARPGPKRKATPKRQVASI